RRKMSDNKGSSFFDSLITFLAGAATGFVLGILFAPASGKETRKKLKEQARKGQELAKEGYEKVSKEAEKGVKIAKEKAEEGIEAIKEFIEKKKGEYVRKEPEFPEDLDTEK
ncbi:MAG: YtxH domain-containing protein, partial [Candidatus Saccharicenans sp.]